MYVRDSVTITTSLPCDVWGFPGHMSLSKVISVTCLFSIECEYGRWPCADGRCIMSEWVCDGENDCAGAEDESSCGNI